MSLEQRLQYLIRAAERAERNGDRRVAAALRRMARDMEPLPGVDGAAPAR